MSIGEAKMHGGGCACEHGLASGAAGGSSVSACLERDHREIDAVLNDVEALASGGQHGKAAELFSRFRGRLERHIEAEEEILFPVYEQLTANDGPTHVMLGEHAEIRRLLAAVAAAFQRPSPTQPLELMPLLARALHVHNMKEERVLYPTTDAALELDGERQALVARLREHLSLQP